MVRALVEILWTRAKDQRWNQYTKGGNTQLQGPEDSVLIIASLVRIAGPHYPTGDRLYHLQIGRMYHAHPDLLCLLQSDLATLQWIEAPTVSTMTF